ncbi:MAG: hypothetical protein ABL962_18675 [Fimbriimonadaceae bacterium]
MPDTSDPAQTQAGATNSLPLTPGRTYFVVSGDSLAAQQLTANFDAAPLRLFGAEGTFLLDSDLLQSTPDDVSEAETLLTSMCGAMRAAGQPVGLGLSIGGSWMQEPDGGPLVKSAFARGSISFGAVVSLSATVLVNGVPQPKPRSLAARITEWLPTAPDEGRDLHLMMIKGEPDWRDIHVIIEHLQELGYPKKKGVQGEVDRIRRTASNWHVVGVDARHSKAKSHQPPKNPPSLSESRAFILDLVRQWFDENAPP